LPTFGHGFESRSPHQSLCGTDSQDSKASACKADHARVQFTLGPPSLLFRCRTAASTSVSYTENRGSSPLAGPRFLGSLVAERRPGMAQARVRFPPSDPDSGVAQRQVQSACTRSTRVRVSSPDPDLWRDWPNGLGTGLWLQSREFDSLISPQWARGVNGSMIGLHPIGASSILAVSTKFSGCVLHSRHG
jgi:hypothetical protein